MFRSLLCAMLLAAGPGFTEIKSVYLETEAGERTHIATLTLDKTGRYQITMETAPFTDHFLSMRPFRCLEGPDKHWCHVPYPYEIARDMSDDLTDLEYDFLFLWKGAAEYGINMWNGVYYRLSPEGNGFRGVIYEMDMDLLSAPPAPGNMRPLTAKDIEPGEAESHWLPFLVIE